MQLVSFEHVDEILWKRTETDNDNIIGCSPAINFIYEWQVYCSGMNLVSKSLCDLDEVCFCYQGYIFNR